MLGVHEGSGQGVQFPLSEPGRDTRAPWWRGHWRLCTRLSACMVSSSAEPADLAPRAVDTTVHGAPGGHCLHPVRRTAGHSSSQVWPELLRTAEKLGGLLGFGVEATTPQCAQKERAIPRQLRGPAGNREMLVPGNGRLGFRLLRETRAAWLPPRTPPLPTGSTGPQRAIPRPSSHSTVPRDVAHTGLRFAGGLLPAQWGPVLMVRQMPRGGRRPPCE